MKSRNRLESFSQDPIGFAAGDANLYRYVGNQPTTKTDPSGLEEVTIDVNTFIPAEWVTLVPGIWLAGDDRGPGDTPDGSYRIKSQITFNTDAIGNALTKSNPGIGQSEIMFGCLLPGIGGGFVSSEFTGTGSASPKQTATGVNGKVELHISNSGNVPRKFVVTAGAPLINYSLTGFLSSLVASLRCAQVCAVVQRGGHPARCCDGILPSPQSNRSLFA